MAMRWKKGSIQPYLAQVERGSVTLTAHILNGELAVHRSTYWQPGTKTHSVGKTWRLSHVRSGRLCGEQQFNRLRDAKVFLERLYALDPAVWSDEFPACEHLREGYRHLVQEFAHCR
jgi:hypothetical protein